MIRVDLIEEALKAKVTMEESPIKDVFIVHLDDITGNMKHILSALWKWVLGKKCMLINIYNRFNSQHIVME